MGLAEEINLFFGKSIPYWGNVFQLNQCRLERTKYLDQCAYSYWGPRLSIAGLPRYWGKLGIFGGRRSVLSCRRERSIVGSRIN